MFSFRLTDSIVLVALAFLCAILLCNARPVSAVEPYTPHFVDPLTEKWRWQRVSNLDGVRLLSMQQANDGSIWIGLQSGLMRYNGSDWERIKINPELDTKRFVSILATRDGAIYTRSEIGIHKYFKGQWYEILDRKFSNGNVKMLETADGSVWILERTGLLQIKNDQATTHNLGNYEFDDMQIDAEENLWLVHGISGDLHIYPITQGKLQKDLGKILTYPYGETKERNSFRLTLTNECAWIMSTRKAYPLRCYERESRRWQHINLREIGSDSARYGIYTDSNGAIWITGQHLINTYRDGRWTSYKYPDFDVAGRNYIFMETASGDIWMGGQFTSVNRIDYGSSRWGKTLEGLHYQCESPGNKRWFIDVAGKIVVHNTNDDSWHTLTVADGLIDLAVSIFTSNDGTVWVSGTHNNDAAIAYYDGNVWKRDLFPSVSQAISPSSVQLHNGDVVFASLYARNMDRPTPREGGLIVYSKKDGAYTYQHIVPASANRRTYVILEDQNQFLWVLHKNRAAKLKDGRRQKITLPAPLAASHVRHAIVTAQGQIWIASETNGIFTFDGKHWRQYTTKNGLPSNKVSYLLALDDGTILSATSEGIARFDGYVWSPTMTGVLPINSKYTVIKHDGKNGFWINLAYHDWYRDPRMSATDKGQDIGAFKTIHYQPDRTTPDTIIETYSKEISFKGFNHVFWTGNDSWSFGKTQQLHYSYRLNGGPWSIFSPGQRHVFSSLNYGTHALEVRSRDSDFNIDPTPARIQFEVIPPLWQQHWFQIAVAFIFIALILFIFMIIRIRERHLVEIDKMKISFFTNVSHELRTPLALILGPLDKLLEVNRDEDQKKILQMIKRNANRLTNLVNQLLDMRKLESGNMQLERSEADIVTYIHELAESLRPLAEEKLIDYSITMPTRAHHCFFDADKFEKILNNLITNAIKYTPEFGEVSIGLRIRVRDKKNKASAEIIIEDTGIGIAKKHVAHIFDQFYRVKNPDLLVDGSGIGLALTKELVEICGGKIAVHSPVEENSGTRFILSLPIDEATMPKSVALNDLPETTTSSATITQNDDSAGNFNGRSTVLVVEDDQDMQDFIRDGIADVYRVLVANDGEAGLAIAKEVVPDLIVTDVMMPKMNGVELCRRLKLDEITSHIPVIILTARGSLSSKLQGLDTGADDYVTKPFQMPLLIVRIKNLLAVRRQLREHYSKEITLQPNKIAINDTDEQFLRRAIATVETHMGQPSFSVEEFAAEMSLKRTALYMKIKALTNHSVQVFIRRIRLERSMQLLKESHLSVSEIASQVGFVDLSYFSHCFKKHFGISPTGVNPAKLQEQTLNNSLKKSS